jgi:2-polyprenyl-3-methyl-5-hydroxy-6-metoxy-1,4-benzoquinol methylase
MEIKPRIFLVSGQPGNGKTSFSKHFTALTSGKHVSLDHIYYKRYHAPRGLTHSDISKHLNDGDFDSKLYLKVFEEEFRLLLEDNDKIINDIVIEGYVLNFIMEEMKELINKLTQEVEGFGVDEVIVCSMSSYSFMYKDRRISFRVSDGKNEKVVKDKIKEVIATMNKVDYDKISRSVSYQTFEQFEGKQKASNSLQKFKSCEYPNMKGKTFLDIGCNSGYFCFKISEQTDEMVMGVDMDAPFINSANLLNGRIFKKPNVSFKQENFFDSKDAFTFDVIQCLSVFHYFPEVNKIEFLKKVHSKLNDGGVFLLEVEEFPSNNTPMVQNKIRPAGGAYDYPNQKWVIENTKELFSFGSRVDSPKQAGSLYNRFVYRLTKK